MDKRKMVVVGIIAIAIMILAVFGGVWSQSYAQNTVPTEKPTKEATKVPGDLTSQFPGVECIHGPLAPDKALDLFVLRYPDYNSTDRWGGADNASGSACQEATEMYCVVPVRYLPKRNQLNYYRQGAEVRQYVKGKVDPTEFLRS